MADYYKNSRDYHDDIDRFEAQRRAEQLEAEQRELERLVNQEGSDTSLVSQLTDAGFGSGGVL